MNQDWYLNKKNPWKDIFGWGRHWDLASLGHHHKAHLDSFPCFKLEEATSESRYLRTYLECWAVTEWPLLMSIKVTFQWVFCTSQLYWFDCRIGWLTCGVMTIDLKILVAYKGRFHSRVSNMVALVLLHVIFSPGTILSKQPLSRLYFPVYPITS